MLRVREGVGSSQPGGLHVKLCVQSLQRHVVGQMSILTALDAIFTSRRVRRVECQSQVCVNFGFNLLKYLIHLLRPVPLLTMNSATQ